MTSISNNPSTAFPAKEELATLAGTICQRFHLPKAYFARIIGNRHHFLAGYGTETFLPATKIDLGSHLCLFVEGKEINPAQAANIVSFIKHR